MGGNRNIVRQSVNFMFQIGDLLKIILISGKEHRWLMKTIQGQVSMYSDKY